MLELVEKFIGPIRSVETEAEARDVLRKIVAELGFRSAFLIEYEPGFTAARHLIDTDPVRAAAWPALFASQGFAVGVAGIRKMLEWDMVVRLGPERFGTDHPYLDFARRHDLLETVAVPITQGAKIAGMISYSGHPQLTRTQQAGLQLLSYSLFAELRSPLRIERRMVPVRPPLTPRERQVMQLSAEGKTSVEIAEELGMAARTVNQHVDNVSEKLGTRNRTHTIAELVRHDML